MNDLIDSVEVSTLDIVKYPHPAMLAKAAPITEVTGQIIAIAEKMIELMLMNDRGIGLAANQVGLPIRMFVCHVPARIERPSKAFTFNCTPSPMICINPTLQLLGKLEHSQEGCLSDPALGEIVVKRHPEAVMEFIDRYGKPQSMRGFDLLARCWQHECDHLDGVNIRDWRKLKGGKK